MKILNYHLIQIQSIALINKCIIIKTFLSIKIIILKRKEDINNKNHLVFKDLKILLIK